MKTKRMLTAITAALALAVSLSAARAETPDATLELHEGSVAAGIGFSWGGGTLTYNGKTYPVTADGLSVGSVGISRGDRVGEGVRAQVAAGLQRQLHGSQRRPDRGRRRQRCGVEKSERGGDRAAVDHAGCEGHVGSQRREARAQAVTTTFRHQRSEFFGHSRIGVLRRSHPRPVSRRGTRHPHSDHARVAEVDHRLLRPG